MIPIQTAQWIPYKKKHIRIKDIRFLEYEY